jgi:hypothetical protein
MRQAPSGDALAQVPNRSLIAQKIAESHLLICLIPSVADADSAGGRLYRSSGTTRIGYLGRSVILG